MGLEMASRRVCFILSLDAKERADTLVITRILFLGLLEDERNGYLFPLSKKLSQLPLHFEGTFTVKTGTSLRTLQFILCDLTDLCMSQ